MEDKRILLYLDDTRDPFYNQVEWDGEIVWVKNYEAFNEYMKDNPMPEKISFDYMLGTGENMFTDGIGCAKSVIRKCLDEKISFPRYSIHSTFKSVSKLRSYIEHAIDMRELGDAVEEDRMPATQEQLEYDNPNQVVNKPRSMGFTQVTNTTERYINHIPIKKTNKQGRNEPCSCGSTKKFKHCCGK